MKDDIKKRFEDYFENIRRETEAAEAAERARLKREEDGVRAFLDALDNYIRPTLENMAEYLCAKGIKAEIIQHGPKDNDRGINMPHSIEVSFPESRKPGVTEPPHFKLAYNRADQIVSVFRRTNDYNLPGERLTIDKITVEFLEEEFSKYFVKGI